MAKEISIVIPFFNEKDWPYKTIQSIYDTTDSSLFEIIAINENAQDFYDFSKFSDVKYIKNNKRIGVDASRQFGVEQATTSRILILDAHELFYPNTNWLNKIIDCVNRDKTIMWCFTCVGIGYGTEDIFNHKGKYYGADLKLYTEKEKSRPARQIIEPVWANKKEGTDYPLQVILGANYAFQKEWFMYIRGLKGLRSWGSSEPFLSIKTWLSGGSCRIKTDIETAHYFRDKAPYTTNICDLVFNKVYMLKTIFPPELEEKLMKYVPNDINLKRAMEMIVKEQKQIEDDRQYYKSIFKRDIYDFCKEFNIEIPK